MRDIIFRGKRIDNGEWILNSETYIRDGDGTWLSDKECNVVKVDPNTVGQFTGLLDKNGVRVFEGDLLRKPPKDQYEETSFVLFEVFYHDGNMCDSHIGWQFNRLHFQGNICGHSGWERFRPEYTGNMIVVGNIHDNLELLTEAK